MKLKHMSHVPSGYKYTILAISLVLSSLIVFMTVFLWRDRRDDGGKAACSEELSRTAASASSPAWDHPSPSPWKTLSEVWWSSGSTADEPHLSLPEIQFHIIQHHSAMIKFRKLSVSSVLLFNAECVIFIFIQKDWKIQWSGRCKSFTRSCNRIFVGVVFRVVCCCWKKMWWKLLKM